MFSFIKKLFGPSTDLKQILADGAIVLDVRTKSEFDAGHIQGSKHIPLDSLRPKLDQIKKLNKPVITVCRSGNRSAMAKTILKNNGIEVYNGGGWLNLKNKYSLK